MSRLASSVPSRISKVPDPGVLWVKAQMLRRWDAERKAQAPLDVMEPIQIAAGTRGGGRAVCLVPPVAASGDPHLDIANNALAEQAIEPRSDERCRSLDLPLPRGIFRFHTQNTVCSIRPRSRD